jgi:hypothetical protein
VSVTVTSSNVVTIAPKFAPLTLLEKQQFTASVPGNAAAQWSVDGVAGGDAAAGTISASGLYAPGSAVGAHTIGATSAANASQTGTATVAVTDLAGIFTRHADGARTGENLQEYALTPAVVGGAGSFGKLFQCTLDGSAYAQPLYVANLLIANAVHNVIFVATENDSVYAFDADAAACVTYWHASFVNGTSIVPVPAAIPYQSSVLANWDILYQIGITGTPVINASSGTLYVVAKTQETDQSNNVVRGQYGPGKVDGKDVKGYRQEERVDPNSSTETYAALKVGIENWRWAGVPFYLRAGKRLAKRVTEITVQFKQPPQLLFKNQSGACRELQPNLIAMRIQPDEGISLRFGAKVPSPNMEVCPVNMNFSYAEAFGKSSANGYERLLLDAMLGDATLFAHRDGVEATWSLLTPILDFWAANKPKDLPNYAAGTWGPKSADELLARDGRAWNKL